jgi:hypothetical protein
MLQPTAHGDVGESSCTNFEDVDGYFDSQNKKSEETFVTGLEVSEILL